MTIDITEIAWAALCIRMGFILGGGIFFLAFIIEDITRPRGGAR